MSTDPKTSNHKTQTDSELDEQSQQNLESFDLQAQIDELQEKLTKAENAKLLAHADLQNFRKNVDTERSKFGIMYNKQLVMQILEIIDDIQLALQDEQLTLEQATHMLQIARDKLLAGLTIGGLEKVEIQIGDKFDPATMEAVTTVPVEAEAQDNTLVAIVSSAFRYAGQSDLVKTAKVVVGKLKK